MLAINDPRYRLDSAPRNADDRTTWFATDRLTGRQVFAKAGPVGAIRREAAILLRLPAGISASPVDLVRDSEGLTLYQERLGGRTLLEAAPGIDVEHDLAPLAGEILRRLEGLHIAGFVHADLKPANLIVLDGARRTEVRLVDLGFAWEFAAPVGGEEGDFLGGTPPFVAPEILRGWAVDGRADLYSLGMTIRSLFPEAGRLQDWREILDRLCEKSPSRRFSSARAAAEEIDRRFGAAAVEPPWRPCFGAGPMRGRERELADVLVRLRAAPPPRSLFVQARPGTGLSRFLLEAVLALDEMDAPARALDLGPSMAADSAAVERFARFLEEETREDRPPLIVGVPDPSPSFQWPCPPLPPRLRARLEAMAAPRVFLRSLDAAAIREIVASSLGRSTPIAEELGRILEAGADGDLRVAAEGFARALEPGEMISAAMPSPSPPPAPGARSPTEALRGWPGEAPGPPLSAFAPRTRDAARLLARVGLVCRDELAHRVIERFGSPEALELLLEEGVVAPREPGRYAFATRRLRQEAFALGGDEAGAIDAWLNENFTPPPAETAETLEAVDRARRLGDGGREAVLLANALADASEGHRWTDIWALIEGSGVRSPGGLGGEGTGAPALARGLEALAERLQWSRARLLQLAGRTRFLLGDAAGLQLLERAAEDPGDPDGIEALCLLVFWLRTAGRMNETEKHWARLEKLEADGRGPAPGIMDLERARRAMFRDEKEEAERLAWQAARLLQGSGLTQEVGGWMLLAGMYSPDRMDEAERFFKTALAVVKHRDVETMIHTGLSQLHETRGDPEASARSAEAACDALDATMSYRHHTACRLQRAWAWAYVDRTREADREAASLLQLAPLREETTRFVVALSLSGYCALCRGEGRSAVSQIAAAWSRVVSVGSAFFRSGALRLLVDALLDTGAWEAVREYGESLDLGPAADHPIARLTTARCRALREQAAGRWEGARDELVPLLPYADTHPGRLEVARFRHHLGVVCLDGAESRIEEAVAHFAAAVELLGAQGYGYFRSRSLLALARARGRAGQPAPANEAIDAAVDLARRCGCRGVLAEALVLRARIGVTGS